ncbi:MAG: DUF433 domain-containing protein [bacterium]|nr:DUF433 domain-containing protein [bacterium]
MKSVRNVCVNSPIITHSKDILGGATVFYGTRVPVQHLLDYLTTGETIDTFLDDFPTVQRAQVIAFLETASAALIANDHENLD